MRIEDKLDAALHIWKKPRLSESPKLQLSPTPPPLSPPNPTTSSYTTHQVCVCMCMCVCVCVTLYHYFTSEFASAYALVTKSAYN